MPQHIRILMVEDSPHDAELIERELRRAKLDFSALRVDTENELRAALQSTDPDIILGDYNLPRFDGITALKIARLLRPDTPFIFVSGSIGEERAVQSLQEGATDYILKDRPSRLAAAITRALDQRRERLLRRHAQEALRLSEERYQYAAKATKEVIWDRDLLTGKVWFNDALRTVWGHQVSPEDVNAEWWEEHIHPDDRGMIDSLRAAVAREARWIGEYRFRRGDGTYGHILDHSVFVRDEEGRTVRVITAMLDITERVRLEKRLEQANRVSSLGRVAATIAHEFNNVLMGIQPFAEIIRRSAAGDDKVQKGADQIISSVARGKRVTQEILRFTQPAEPSVQTVVLSEWLHQLMPELRVLIGQRIDLAVEVPARPIAARCDPAQLQQVLTNLVLNARDAIAGDGKITLTVSDAPERQHLAAIPDDMVLLAVRDTGSGMTPKVLDQIFEPLFTTKRSGTGLGLAVAQQVIVRHGGSIHAESAPGKGTTFFIFLPAAAPVAVARTERRPDSVRIRRVLLVEDEEAVARGIAAVLESEGIEVRVVDRGTEAHAAAQSFVPDVVVLDLHLPDISGIEVFADLKISWPDLPVIFSSGHADEAALEQQIASGSVGFLRKPYDSDALLDALQKVVARRERVTE